MNPYPDGVDTPDAMMQYLDYRCFLYSSLRESPVAPYQARQLAPGDMAELLTRTMRVFLHRVLERPEEQHRPPHGQTSAMIRMLRDSGILNRRNLVSLGEVGGGIRRATSKRIYTVTVRGRSVLAHIPAFKELL